MHGKEDIMMSPLALIRLKIEIASGFFCFLFVPNSSILKESSKLDGVIFNCEYLGKDWEVGELLAIQLFSIQD